MTPEAAVAYLRDKWLEWQRLPARIEHAMGKAAFILGMARAQENTATAAKAEATLGALSLLRRTVLVVNDKVKTAHELIDQAGLGAIPLVVAAAAIVAAAGMALVYKALEHNERILDDIEAGILPPEAIGTGGIGAGIGRGIGQALVPIALIGGALWAGSELLKRRAA